MILSTARIKPSLTEQGPLHRAICDAFSPDGLTRFVKYRVGIVPEDVFPQGSDKPKCVDRLLEEVDRTDSWNDFLLLVCLDNPTNRVLLDEGVSGAQ
jgi:hypothetical protein